MKILSVEYARLKQPGFQHVIMLMHRDYHERSRQWLPAENNASHRFFISQLVKQFGPPGRRWRLHYSSRLTARFHSASDAMLFRISVNPADYDAF